MKLVIIKIFFVIFSFWYSFWLNNKDRIIKEKYKNIKYCLIISFNRTVIIGGILSFILFIGLNTKGYY